MYSPFYCCHWRFPNQYLKLKLRIESEFVKLTGEFFQKFNPPLIYTPSNEGKTNALD
jgi:hypothetical protein